MPELPEVETVVRCLRPRLYGQTIADVAITWERLVAAPDQASFCQRLVGLELGDVTRRGKYILIQASPYSLVAHLRMTGNLLVVAQGQDFVPDGRHVRMRMAFVSGDALWYRDMRKFGRWWLVDDPETVVGRLGPEPLSDALTLARFDERIHRYRRQLKPALLDQSVIAGLGNIYVDETLWQAELHPLRHTHTLSDAETQRLYASMRDVLRRAIDNGGTTLSDFRNPENEPGHHQLDLAVYHRHGETCHRCGAVIERTTVGQRGTHFCPICQQKGA